MLAKLRYDEVEILVYPTIILLWKSEYNFILL